MCGRYVSAAESAEIVEEFGVVSDHTGEPVRSILRSEQTPPVGTPDFNVAPSKNVRVVLERAERRGDGADRPGDPVRQLRLLTWGLVPSWATDPSVGSRMTNARAETLLDKPAFRSAGRSRRALIPADGWYEWQKSPTVLDRGRPRKQPFFIHRDDGVPLALAGLYEFWRDPAGDPADTLSWLATVTIITTAADSGIDRIHDRQPLVLEPDAWARWLDPECRDRDEIEGLLRFAAPGRFAAHPVGRAVGSSAAAGPHLIDPAPPAELQGVVDPMTGEILG